MLQMYDGLTRLLNEAAVDDRVVITALTGAGDVYSSGNDMPETIKSMGDGDFLQILNRLRYG